MKIAPECLDQLFLKARTANGFLDKPVALSLLREVYDIEKMGATSMNTQPTRYVFLLSPESHARLLPALAPGNLEQPQTAPSTVRHRTRAIQGKRVSPLVALGGTGISN